MKIPARRVLGLFLSMAVFSPAATITTYTNRTLWEGDVHDETTDTFETLTPGNYAYLGNGAVTIQGVQFSSFVDTQNWDQYLSNYPGTVNDWESGTILKAADILNGHTAKFHIVLPSNTQAFGLDLMMLGGSGYYDISIDGAATVPLLTYGRPDRAFFGATSTNAMSVIDIFTTVNNIAPALDNFSLATPGSAQINQDPPPAGTPETHTFLLCASGLLAVSRLRKHFQ